MMQFMILFFMILWKSALWTQAAGEGREMSVVIVSGPLANKVRNGGHTWERLSWAVGLRRLGFDAYFVEQIAPEACVDAAGKVTGFEESINAEWFRAVTRWFGFGERAVLVCGGGERCIGATWPRLLEIAEDAALLVNIGGHITLAPLLERVRCKAYVDVDPGFTQFWQADPGTRFEFGGHDFYFTIGENIGTPGCPIPTGGLRWRPTRQPVVLADWPVASVGQAALPVRDAGADRQGCLSHDARFTTIASWRGGFGPVQFGGRTYGLKVHEFRKVLPLPGRVAAAAFEIALDIHPGDAKDLAALREHGWRIVEPRAVAASPAAFRDYVQGSGAEFSVAQGIYVDTNSGWFSDRTVRYLASGKPVLVQDTGFRQQLPTGEGLVSFRTLEEAVAGAERIVGDYDAHCRAARQIAEEHFDSDRVLRRFMEEVGVAP
jgi:hypothetical protein